jgi:hypothetical protein
MIHASPTGIISSLPPPRCSLSSGRCRHTIPSCHASFPLSQDGLAASASSSSNSSSRRLPSQAETEALNLHHHRRLPSPDLPTPTHHCYKKIISTLVTLPTTQPHLHLAFSLAKAPCHRSSTHRHCFLSPLSHTHHLSTQRHPW